MGAERRRPRGAAGAPLISDAEAGDAADLRALFREYAASLGDAFNVADFEEELVALPGYYEVLLVARIDGELVGSVALKRLPDDATELKRLYVRPSARGTGLGRRLAQAAVDRARDLGYARILLDTLPSMTVAGGIYRELAFVPVARYNDNPIPGVTFFELQL